eukprot:3222758-Prymnesium_polylepis.1
MGRSAPQPSPAQQPQRMALDSRSKEHSVVLDPARLSQRARRVDASAGVQPCSVRAAASGGMSAYNCFQCGIMGG